MSDRPDEKYGVFKLSSWRESIAFWKYLGIRGVVSVILFLLSTILLFLVIDYLYVNLSNASSSSMLGFAIFWIVFMSFLMFFSIPSASRAYKNQFKEKIKPGISDEELTRAYMDSIPKLYIGIAIGTFAISILLMLIYGAAKYLALSNVIMAVLLIMAGINAFVLVFGVSPLRIWNRDMIRKIFTEEEWNRYARLDRYKNFFIGLIVFDVLAVMLLIYILINGLTMIRTIILLAGFGLNAFIIMSLMGYEDLEGESESYRRSGRLQIKKSLTIFTIADLLFIVALLAYNYITRSFSDFTILTILVFIISPALIALGLIPPKKLAVSIKRFLQRPAKA